VALVSTPTSDALLASTADLTHHTPSDPARRLRLLNDTNEFVAKHASKVQTASHDLEIRVTDASQVHPYQRFPNRERWFFVCPFQSELISVN
jgi:hypothetical protein